MSTPIFKVKGTSYVFDWKDEMLQIEVSKIHSRNGSGLSCLLTATTTHPDWDTHLYQGNFNPQAPRTKKELKRDLSEAYKPKNIDIDWNEIVEQVSVNTIEQYESGEPVEEIWSTNEWEKPGYLLDPIIPLSKPTIIFGDPGTGKSELALMFGIIILLPLENNKLNLIPPPRMYKPLILDYEADKPEIGWRLKALQEGMGLPPLILNYRRCYLPFSQDVEQIQQHILTSESEFLIIDSLGPACGGELKDAGPALDFFGALRRLKTNDGSPVTALVIAHTAKNGDANGKRSIYGSMFFEAISRSVWEINGDQEEDSDDINVSMKHTKANMSKRHGTIGFNINFADNKTVIKSINPKDIAGLVERMGANTKILTLLKDGPKNNDQIQSATGLSSDNIYKATQRLKDKKLIVKVNGLWGLVSNAQN